MLVRAWTKTLFVIAGPSLSLCCAHVLLATVQSVLSVDRQGTGRRFGAQASVSLAVLAGRRAEDCAVLRWHAHAIGTRAN
eukprot:6057263-Pleurochrysis_carterae.AAC.2